MAEFTWSAKAGRYRDPTSGKFVSEAKVVEGVNALVQHSAERLDSIAQRFKSGELTTVEFQSELLAEIRNVHLAAAMAGYGGRSAMDAGKYGFVSSQVRAQYEYARGFIDDVLSGKQSDGRLVQRARSYANAARITYEAVREAEADERGQNEARNILGARESCTECKALAGRGWISANDMPAVGTRQCGSNCRCTIERRANVRTRVRAASA